MTDDELTIDEIALLGRIKTGAERIEEAIERLNTLSAQFARHRHPIRPMQTCWCGMVRNDISILLVLHQEQIDRARDEAIERLPKYLDENA